MRIQFLAAVFAALLFVPATPSQQVVGGPDPDRKSSTVYVMTDTFEALAGVSISYSPPTWQDSYNDMLGTLRGNYTRLGKHWWTTLDTVGALEIGGTKIAAGSYYLGLAVGKEGAFSLLVFDSKQAMKAGLLPAASSLFRGEAKAELQAPLTFAKDSLKEVVAKMEIEITADKNDPANGKLSIRWGKHELSAPVKFQLAVAKAVAAPKK